MVISRAQRGSSSKPDSTHNATLTELIWPSTNLHSSCPGNAYVHMSEQYMLGRQSFTLQDSHPSEDGEVFDQEQNLFSSALGSEI